MASTGEPSAFYHLRDVQKFVEEIQCAVKSEAAEDVDGRVLAICEAQVAQTRRIEVVRQSFSVAWDQRYVTI
jgi:hypothetical protein